MINIDDLDQQIINYLSVQDIQRLSLTNNTIYNNLKNGISKAKIKAWLLLCKNTKGIDVKNIPLNNFNYYLWGKYDDYDERSIVTYFNIDRRCIQILSLNVNGVSTYTTLYVSKFELYSLLINLYYHHLIK